MQSESYQEILTLLDTSVISLFNWKRYWDSICIGAVLSGLRCTILILATEAGPSIIKGDAAELV